MRLPCLLAPVLPLLGLLPLAPAQAQDSHVLRQFGAGSGANAIGVVEARPDVEIEGPQAIASGDNGEIYLLDQVNSRVLSFESSQ